MQKQLPSVKKWRKSDNWLNSTVKKAVRAGVYGSWQVEQTTVVLHMREKREEETQASPHQSIASPGGARQHTGSHTLCTSVQHLQAAQTIAKWRKCETLTRGLKCIALIVTNDTHSSGRPCYFLRFWMSHDRLYSFSSEENDKKPQIRNWLTTF